MKYLLTLFTSLILLGYSYAQPFSAMTYNIRYDTENDGINRWDNRKEWLAQQVKRYDPDFLGIQEGLHHQVSYLDSSFTRHSYVGVGRDDGKTKGEYAALFYNSAQFEVLKSDTFWLSETPGKSSVGWDASMERICTYGLFENKKNGQQIWVFNAHLDHIGEISRLESLRLISQKLQEMNKAGLPAVVMGDFNAVPGSAPIDFLSEHLKDAKSASSTPPKGPVGTYNGFEPDSLSRRIDYVFVNSVIEVQSYEVVNEINNSRTPSDHLPVFVVFDIE